MNPYNPEQLGRLDSFKNHLKRVDSEIEGIVPGKLREELLDFQVHYLSQKELEENYEQTIDFIAHKIASLVMNNVLKLPDLSQILKTLINPNINLPELVTDSGTLISAVVGALRKACPYWHDEGTSILNAIDQIEDAIDHHDSTSGDHDRSRVEPPLEKTINHNIRVGMFPKADIQEMKEKILHHQAIVDAFFDEHVIGYKDGCTEIGIAYVYFNPQKIDKKALRLASARAANSISRMKSKQYTVVLIDVHKCRELLRTRNGDTKQKEDAEVDRKFTKAEPDSYRRDQNSSNEETPAKEDSQPHDLNSQSVVTGYNLPVVVDDTCTLPLASPVCNVCPVLVSEGYMHSEPEQLQEQQKPFFKQVSCGNDSCQH